MQTMRHIAFASFEAQRPLHEGSLPDVNGKCFHAVVWGQNISCAQKKSHAVYVRLCPSVRLRCGWREHTLLRHIPLVGCKAVPWCIVLKINCLCQKAALLVLLYSDIKTTSDP